MFYRFYHFYHVLPELTVENRRWDFINFTEDCYNHIFKAWSELRRRRGEDRVLTNKLMHITNGNITESYLKVIFQNVPAYHIPRKDQEIAIKQVLQEHQPGLLGIAEPSYESLNLMWFPGYKLLKGKLSGGKKFRLNVLVKDTLLDYKVESFTTDIPSLLINVEGFKFLFYYREWRKDGVEETKYQDLQNERWANFLSRAKKIGGKLFMLGDANLDFLREDTAHQKRLNKIRESMYEFLAEKGYGQIIKEDTRSQGGQVGLLDHIYTGQMKHVANVYNSNIHGHDHNAIGVNVRMDKAVFRSKIITVRNYDKADVDYYDQIWVQSNPAEIWSTSDIGRMIETLEHKIRHVNDIVVPEKKYRSAENYAPWVDSGLKREIRKRDLLKKKAQTSKSPAVEREFRAKKKEVRDKLREAESNYLNNYLNFSDEKTGWRRLKEVSKLKQNNEEGINLMINGQLESDPEVVAPFMANFFKTKVDKIVAEVPPDPVESSRYMMEYMRDKEPGNFEFQTVSFKYVKRVIMKLKNVSSTGLDGIPVIVYKKFRRSLTPAIARIINECIKQGIYPERLKSGTVVPIPKKGCLTDVANWRPIVLLPVLSKILEGVMTKQLRHYLEAHGLIHHSQHAYRESRGCLSCWADLDTAVSHARDQGKAIGLLQTDMTSAFNCANAASLIPKLRLAGVGLESCRLILSYMTERTIRVKIDYFTSEPLILQTGSGEGTQISPLIWLIFILDTEAVLDRVKTILEARSHPLRPRGVRQQNAASYRIADKNYADDINTLCVAGTNEEILEIMKVVEQEYGKYFKSLGLKESKGKQMHILFSKEKIKGAEYKLNNRNSEKSTRLLGVTVTEDWTFDLHVSNVCRRMMERIPHIQAVRDNVSRKILTRVSRSLVLSIYEFACEITLQNLAQQKRVQRVMNILLRVITFSDIMRSVSSMLKETELLNVALTVKYYSVWSIERLLHDRNAAYPYSLIDFAHSTGRYTTRHHRLHLLWRPIRFGSMQNWLIRSLDIFNQLELFMSNWVSESDDPRADLKSWLLANFPNKNL